MIAGMYKFKKGDFFLHYQIMDIVGQGGMGIVYRAVDTQVKRVIALKILYEKTDDRAIKRFQREARILAKIKHPNVIPINTAGEHEGMLYLVMPYVDAIAIDKYIVKKNLDDVSIVQLVIKICETLDFVHSKAVVHRDVKPGNILVDDEGNVHIIDFGIAKIQTNKEVLTQSKDVIGTLLYMSPEQINGENKHITHRTDIYSVGVLLHALLAKKLPYGGQQAINISYQICTGQLDICASIHSKLSGILKIAMAKKEKQRYASFKVMVNDLKRYCDKKNLGISHLIKKSRTKILSLSVVLVLVSIVLFSRERLFSLASQEIGIINGDEQTSRVIQNLIDNEFYSEAQEEWQKIENKNNIYVRLLQLKIWDGKEEYGKVWSEDVEVTSEIAALKIKAGYYLEKDLEVDKEIQEYKKIIDLAIGNPAYNMMQCYDLFFVYHRKKYSIPQDKYKAFIELYEKIATHDTLSTKDQIELFVVAGNSYLQTIKQETIPHLKNTYIEKYLDKAIYCYESALAINNNSFAILKGLADCLLHQQKNTNNADNIKIARGHLLKCCELRPNDWESRLLLARTYIGNRDEHYLAYLHFEHACSMNKNATEPLDAVFELSLKDARYQEEIFWMFEKNVIERQTEEIPDFLFGEIETIREQNQPRYMEYSNNEGIVDINVIMRNLSIDNNDYKVRAIKALVMAGYRQNITLEINQYIQNTDSNEVSRVLLGITTKIKENKKGLLQFFLADLYLHNSIYSKKELEKLVPEIKDILYDKGENILVRYLAAKAIIRILLWDILIDKMDFFEDSDLVLICHVALYETGFIFPLEHLENPKVKIENYYQIVLYGRILCFDNSAFVQYSIQNGIRIYKMELQSRLTPFLENDTHNSEQQEIIRCIAAVVVGKHAQTANIWHTCSNVLKESMESPKNIIRNYAHYFYWQSYMIKTDREDTYIKYLQDYTHFLDREDVSYDTKLMILNAKHLYDSGKSSAIFEIYPKIKSDLIATLENILIYSSSDALRLKTSYVIGLLVPYEETFNRIILNQDLPATYRILIYICSSVRLLLPFFHTKKLDMATLGDKLQLLMAFAEKQWAIFLKIMESNDSREFKSIVYQMASLLGGKYLQHLDSPSTNDDLRASILMCLTGNNIFAEYQMVVASLTVRLRKHKDPTLREQKGIISQYLQSPTTNTRISAWASKAFLMHEKEIDNLSQDINNNKYDSIEKSGIALGLYYKMRKETIEKNLITSLSSISYRMFYQIYIETLKEKILDIATAKKYLKYLHYASSLEENSVYKAQYKYEEAIVLNILGEKEKALQVIKESLQLMQPFKEQITEVWQRYELFKVSLLENTDKEKMSILSTSLPNIDKDYLLSDFIEITLQHSQTNNNPEWVQLHQQAVKQQILSLYSIDYSFSSEVFVFQNVTKMHLELAKHSENKKIKAFHQQIAKIIQTVLDNKK